MQTRIEKTPVSERALIGRINRKLADIDERLKKCTPGSRWSNELGEFYTVNVRYNWLLDRDVDLETLGHDLGVLRTSEELQ